MSKFTHDVLAVELGEAHMRFAVADTDRLTIDHFVQFGNDTFGAAAEALVAYIRSVPNPPRATAIAATDGAHLPSSGELECQLTAADFGSGIPPSTIRIVDALEALASVLQDLAPHDVERLAGDSPVDHAPKVAICATDRIGVAARFVADIALVYDAQGGIYLWGPLLRKIERILSSDNFRLAFEARASAQPWLGQVPVLLIKGEEALLKGTAMALVRSTG